nr:helix-turn-helix domain-containing protein [Blautia sp. OF11-22]
MLCQQCLSRAAVSEKIWSFLQGLSEQFPDGAGRRLLIRTDKKIVQIAEEVGYHDLDYFVNRFIQVKGCTPARFRKQMQQGS